MKKLLTTALVAVIAALSLTTSAMASGASHREALEAAKSYLRSGHFSKAGLIEQLSSEYGEGFSRADARWAVAQTHANWNAEAVEAAKSYLRSGHFSRASLIDQLQSEYGENFTHAQAVYGVNKAYR